MTLEDLHLALRAHALEPVPAGRAAWRSACPACGRVDAVGWTWNRALGAGVLARCGCPRDRILDALGLGESS